MNEIITKNNSFKFEYNGFKLIHHPMPNKFIKDLYGSNIVLNGKKYKEYIVISDLTKNKDLINLNRNSNLFLDINNELSSSEFINKEILIKISDKINEKLKYDLISIEEGDIKKIIDIFFNINLDNFINYEIFDYYLTSEYNNEKKLIILNDLSFVKVNQLMKYLNSFDILLITNDVRKYLSTNINELESLLIIINDEEYTDITSKETLINFLELNMNVEFNDLLFKKIIEETWSLESNQFISLIQKICK